MGGITTITAIVGTAVAVVSLANGVWQYRRKVQLEIFRTYADKYNAILTPEMYEKWRAALNGEQQYWAELTPTMISYLNLIWEELFLKRDRVIDGRLWGLWLPGICHVLASDFAKVVQKSNGFHFPSDLS
jgi:hypothetical protein